MRWRVQVKGMRFTVTLQLAFTESICERRVLSRAARHASDQKVDVAAEVMSAQIGYSCSYNADDFEECSIYRVRGGGKEGDCRRRRRRRRASLWPSLSDCSSNFRTKCRFICLFVTQSRKVGLSPLFNSFVTFCHLLSLLSKNE
jgi:hypothetical protein